MAKLKFVCRKVNSQNMNKKIWTPFLVEGKRTIQPKFASLGENEEYPTHKMCRNRLRTLNKKR